MKGDIIKMVEDFYNLDFLDRGDSLSPFLFQVVAEAFGAIISKVVQGDILEGFEVGGEWYEHIPSSICG